MTACLVLDADFRRLLLLHIKPMFQRQGIEFLLDHSTMHLVLFRTLYGQFRFLLGLSVFDCIELGIELLIVSNASGGVNPSLRSGDVVVIEDHINLMFDNPLIGPNDDRLGERFPDMSAPYDAEINQRALTLARQHGFQAQLGVYAGMTGPNYETRAEYRLLRTIGVDVVGMSTVPEVIVARHAGLRVLALSAVTNVCDPDQLTSTSGEAVVAAAESTEPKMRDIVTGVLRTLDN